MSDNENKCKFSDIFKGRSACMLSVRRSTGNGWGIPTATWWADCEGLDSDKKNCPYWNTPQLVNLNKPEEEEQK
jgi:hypothetical protein